MKTIINSFRTQPLHNKCLCAIYLLVLLALPFIIGMKPANAQSGNVYAIPQAQAAGNVYEATVLQIQYKEVEPSVQARGAGAAVGGALGLALAARSGSEHRFAVGTLGTVLGGLLGERSANAIATTQAQAQEIIVRLAPLPGQEPRIVSIVQPAPFDRVYPGEMIYVTVTQGAWRVLRRTLPPATLL